MPLNWARRARARAALRGAPVQITQQHAREERQEEPEEEPHARERGEERGEEEKRGEEQQEEEKRREAVVHAVAGGMARASRGGALSRLTPVAVDASPTDGFALDFGDALTPELAARVEAALLAALARGAGGRGEVVQRRDAARILVDALPLVGDGVSDIVLDGFTQCFEAEEPRRWSWGYLAPFYGCGVAVRYCVLLPMRVAAFGVATLLLGVWMALCRARGVGRRAVAAGLSAYAQALVFAVGGVVTYHGARPRYGGGQIFAANHTTMLDWVFMLGLHPFSVVGQRHGGLVGWFQRHVFDALRCVWFERGRAADRAHVRRRIQAHVAAHDVPPLCVFPEGTCVNNRFALQFKQGAFELRGVDVHPVAIVYDKAWAVGFWDSRRQSFGHYLLRLMTSWCLVVDLYFLPPARRRDGESPREFAARVKHAIAQRAGLTKLPWDGYLKHQRPSEKFLKERQKRVVAELLAEYDLNGEASE